MLVRNQKNKQVDLEEDSRICDIKLYMFNMLNNTYICT